MANDQDIDNVLKELDSFYSNTDVLDNISSQDNSNLDMKSKDFSESEEQEEDIFQETEATKSEKESSIIQEMEDLLEEDNLDDILNKFDFDDDTDNFDEHFLDKMDEIDLEEDEEEISLEEDLTLEQVPDLMVSDSEKEKEAITLDSDSLEGLLDEDLGWMNYENPQNDPTQEVQEDIDIAPKQEDEKEIEPEQEEKEPIPEIISSQEKDEGLTDEIGEVPLPNIDNDRSVMDEDKSEESIVLQKDELDFSSLNILDQEIQNMNTIAVPNPSEEEKRDKADTSLVSNASVPSSNDKEEEVIEELNVVDDQPVNSLEEMIDFLPNDHWNELTELASNIASDDRKSEPIVIPMELVSRIEKYLEDPLASKKNKKILSRLIKHPNPSLSKIEHILGEKNLTKRDFMIFKLFPTVLILLVVLGGVYSIVLPYILEDYPLKKGLVLIKRHQFEEANDLFTTVNPQGTKWYNKYAEAFMDQNAFPYAEEKLMGVMVNQNHYSFGAVDIDPYDEQTRLNIASFYKKQFLYEQVLENDQTPEKQRNDSLHYLVSHYPKNYRYKNLLADTYLEWAEYDSKNKKVKINQALNILLPLSKKYPEDIDIQSSLVQAYLLQGQYPYDVMKKLGTLQLANHLTSTTLRKLGYFSMNHGLSYQLYQAYRALHQKDELSSEDFLFFGDFNFQNKDIQKAEFSYIEGIKKYYQGKKKPFLRVLSRLNLGLANVYYAHINLSSQNQYNQQFRKLATYHLKEAQEADASNPYIYYVKGNIDYYLDKNYKKARDKFVIAYEKLKENNLFIPNELFYNLGRSYYINQEYQKTIDLIQERPFFAEWPSFDYLKAMSYHRLGIIDQARFYYESVLDYFKDQVILYMQTPKASSAQQNKIFYFVSTVHNNLGAVYQDEAVFYGEPEKMALAREEFYQAMTLSNRTEGDMIEIPESVLNMKNSLLSDNLSYVENFGVGVRNANIYEFMPEHYNDLM